MPDYGSLNDTKWECKDDVVFVPRRRFRKKGECFGVSTPRGGGWLWSDVGQDLFWHRTDDFARGVGIRNDAVE